MKKEKSFKEVNIDMIKKSGKYAVIIGIIGGFLIGIIAAMTDYGGVEFGIIMGIIVGITLTIIMLIIIIFVTYLEWFLDRIRINDTIGLMIFLNYLGKITYQKELLCFFFMCSD